jgi:hypothetical protein
VDVKVSDEVIIVDHHRSRYNTQEPRKGVVVKVARKYFTVEMVDAYTTFGQKRTMTSTKEFAIANGYERSDSNYRSNYGWYAYTPEAYAEKQAREAALNRFKEFGLGFDYAGTYTEMTIPTKKLLAIIEILEASDG